MDSDTKLLNKLPGRSELRPLLEHFAPPGSAFSDKRLGRWISVGIVMASAVLGLIVLYHINYYPRTDDAEVVANFIGLARKVEGPILRLRVNHNQLVKQGELLFEIVQRNCQES